MRIVVDASVAVKWFVLEDRREIARRLASDGVVRIAPDFLNLEVGSVLSRKLRDGQIDRSQCQVAMSAIAGGLVTIVPASIHIGRAFQLSVQIRHAMYDCLYLAVAEAEDALFVTDDEKFGRKCVELGFSERVSTLRNLGLP